MKPPMSNGSTAEPAYIGTTPPQSVEPSSYGNGTPNHYAHDVAEPIDHPTHISDVPRSSPLLSNLIFLLMGALLASGGIFVTRQPTAQPIQIQPPPTVAATATALPEPTPEPITVFVSGAVHAPGLYELVGTPRIGDVLQMAGGLLPDAESSLINQAERLFDGAQVHVPSAIGVVDVEVQQGDGALPLVNNQPPAGISGAPAAALPLSNGASGPNSNLINVNTATAAELETLPGVGASRAAEIIAGRPYAAIDDLQKVSGIGAKTVEKLRPLVRVD